MASTRALSFLAAVAAVAAAPPPPPQTLLFSFDSAFGSNMLLQQAPAKAAVYGFLDFNASMAGAAVQVTLTPESGAPITVQAVINATVQTFGADWGVRSLNASECPGCLPPYNPWNSPLATWKALLPPQAAGGNFTVTAVCTGCSALAPSSISISNLVFGDVWYCTGQVRSVLLSLPSAAEAVFTPRTRKPKRPRPVKHVAPSPTHLLAQ